MCFYEQYNRTYTNVCMHMYARVLVQGSASVHIFPYEAAFMCRTSSVQGNSLFSLNES